jgi:hypothetical protein
MREFLLSTLVLSIFTMVCFNSYSQRKCGTYEHNQALMQADPNFAQQQKDIENFTSEFLKNGGSRSMSNLMNLGTNVYTIPVVVHVIWNKDVQNISNAQIKSQIAVLNRDYQMKNDDIGLVPAAFKALRGDFKIKFCLATVDPNGNPTKGIVRKQTTRKSFSDNDYVKLSSRGGDDAWDASKYLNLWVCNLGGGLLGYAQFPGGSVKTDGVVILYSAFGNTGVVAPPYDKGRTATHEIGHWLNLRHIWGDDNGACTGSDLVDDTPNQGNYNFGCPSFPHRSCSNGPNGDMFMNYMDYTDDACMFMFTIGQRDRSYAVLKPGGARYSVTQSGKCGGSTKTSQIAVAAEIPNGAIKIYPQPANTYANLEFKSGWKGNTTITVLNEMGAVVTIKQVNADSRSYRLNVNSLKSGVYYIRLNNNNEATTQKIVIQH